MVAVPKLCWLVICQILQDIEEQKNIKHYFKKLCENMIKWEIDVFSNVYTEISVELRGQTYNFISSMMPTNWMPLICMFKSN